MLQSGLNCVRLRRTSHVGFSGRQKGIFHRLHAGHMCIHRQNNRYLPEKKNKKDAFTLNVVNLPNVCFGKQQNNLFHWGKSSTTEFGQLHAHRRPTACSTNKLAYFLTLLPDDTIWRKGVFVVSFLSSATPDRRTNKHSKMLFHCETDD